MVKPKPKLERKSLIPPSILASIIAVLFVASAVSIVGAVKNDLSRIETTEQSKTTIVSTPKAEAATEPQNKPVEKPAEKKEEPKKEAPKVDPNGCEAKGMYYRADNNECIPKPATSTAPAAVASTGGGSGSCQAEIAKYNWDHGVATAVMIAESGGSTSTVNNNPSTGDYSIGCFQINIYGANAASRPSEAALKNAAVNVEFAHRIYSGNGNSFIGQWGVCRSKVSCY